MPFGGGGSGVILPVSIGNGGTGQTTAAAALAALGGAANGAHTLKAGSGSADYTTNSSSFVEVDSALKVTRTVPVGSIAWAVFTGTGQNASAHPMQIGVSIDSATPLNFVQISASGGTVPQAPFCAQAVLVGDGSSHTFDPQFLSTSGASSATIFNSGGAGVNCPVFMVLVLSAS